MRQRLRDGYNRAQLGEMYGQPFDHTATPGGVERVEQTIGFALEHIAGPVAACPYIYYVADLSAGDAAIPKRIFQHYPEKIKLYLGDLAPAWALRGTIGEMLSELPDAVDLYVCCETLQLVDHPDKLLQELRFHAGALLVSAPIENFDDPDERVLWCWSRPSVEEMLTSAGWQPVGFRLVDNRPEGYAHGIWYCQ